MREIDSIKIAKYIENNGTFIFFLLFVINYVFSLWKWITPVDLTVIDKTFWLINHFWIPIMPYVMIMIIIPPKIIESKSYFIVFDFLYGIMFWINSILVDSTEFNKQSSLFIHLYILVSSLAISIFSINFLPTKKKKSAILVILALIIVFAILIPITSLGSGELGGKSLSNVISSLIIFAVQSITLPTVAKYAHSNGSDNGEVKNNR